jgi:hypothetical protein
MLVLSLRGACSRHDLGSVKPSESGKAGLTVHERPVTGRGSNPTPPSDSTELVEVLRRGRLTDFARRIARARQSVATAAVRLAVQFSNVAQLPDCELGPARCFFPGGWGRTRLKPGAGHERGGKASGGPRPALSAWVAPTAHLPNHRLSAIGPARNAVA